MGSKFDMASEAIELQEYKKKDNGYSQGPKIFQAIEILKRKSHM